MMGQIPLSQLTCFLGFIDSKCLDQAFSALQVGDGRHHPPHFINGETEVLERSNDLLHGHMIKTLVFCLQIP